MCLCTLYDSPTCGHSWYVLSKPCPNRDFLSCLTRHVERAVIAQEWTCSACNGAFFDPETVQMVPGPWGCNQLIRDRVGGQYAIPHFWENALMNHGGWEMVMPQPLGSAITSAFDHRIAGPYSQQLIMPGPTVTSFHDEMTMSQYSQALIPTGPAITSVYDHRFAGPYSQPLIAHETYYRGPGGFDDGVVYEDFRRIDSGVADHDWDCGYSRRRKCRRRHSFRYSSGPTTSCTVM